MDSLLMTDLEDFVAGHRTHGDLFADASTPARTATGSRSAVTAGSCSSGGCLGRASAAGTMELTGIGLRNPLTSGLIHPTITAWTDAASC
jgi:hypothetical protein